MKKLVIGNGLIGSVLSENTNVFGTFFCSGVSFSGETRDVEFQRELSLLNNYLTIPGPKYYFSSLVQVSPGAKNTSLYNMHKFKIENMLLGYPDWFIIRLPQVVGSTGNRNNLFNYFKFKALSGEKINLNTDSLRSIIDIKDIPEIIIRNTQNTKILNVISPCIVNATTLYFEICNRLEKKPNFNLFSEFDILSDIITNSKELTVHPDNIENSVYFKTILDKYI